MQQLDFPHVCIFIFSVKHWSNNHCNRSDAWGVHTTALAHIIHTTALAHIIHTTALAHIIIHTTALARIIHTTALLH